MNVVSAVLLLAVFLIVPLTMLGVGVFLLISSRRTGRRFPACGGCQYNISGIPGKADRCPECGKEFEVVGIVPAGPIRSRPRKYAGLILIVLAMIPLLFVGVSMFMAALASANATREVQARQDALRAAEAAVRNRQGGESGRAGSRDTRPGVASEAIIANPTENPVLTPPSAPPPRDP